MVCIYGVMFLMQFLAMNYHQFKSLFVIVGVVSTDFVKKLNHMENQIRVFVECVLGWVRIWCFKKDKKGKIKKVSYNM